MFVNYGLCHLRQTFDEMFASQQGLWSRKFVQDVSLQWTLTNDWILIK